MRYALVHKHCGHTIGLHPHRDTLTALIADMGNRGRALRIRLAQEGDREAVADRERCEQCTTGIGIPAEPALTRPAVQRAVNEAGRLHPQA